MKFNGSRDAKSLLAGLRGVEIGGSAHNPFGLNTINVDRFSGTDTVCKQSEQALCGEVLPVDVIAEGDELPFGDRIFDFVISSHVIEYFYDPVRAIREWCRVSRRYVFIICPHKGRANEEDRLAEETTHADLLRRMRTKGDSNLLVHQTFWTLGGFLAAFAGLLPPGWRLVLARDPDDKVGNGFTVVYQRVRSKRATQEFKPDSQRSVSRSRLNRAGSSIASLAGRRRPR
jgi:SAM-dependent methyltransferase